jgi:hypothetical protein
MSQLPAMTKKEILEICGWPDIPFSFYDEPGEHDPCYVVMPGGCTLALNHCAPGMMDITRAKFIIDACNEKLKLLESL